MSVFVTGANGFVAQHVVKELVKNSYKVVGTVRSAAKGDVLKSKFNDAFDYEIVEDIQVDGAFDEALKAHPEVKVILHTASPFNYKVKEPKELLNPAIQGTKTILASTKKFAPQVERVVITSSFAAVLSPNREGNPETHYSEKDWNNITYEDALKDLRPAYLASKTFAERSAWEFVEQEKPNFALSTVNPAFVFGPQAFDDQVTGTLNTSSEVVNSLLHTKLGQEDYVKSNLFWIDARDVAKAHLAAFEKEETKGQRLILADTRFTEQSILDVLNEIPVLKGKIAVGVPGSDVIAAAAASKLDNSKTRSLLGFDFMDIKTSITDSANQILEYEAKQK